MDFLFPDFPRSGRAGAPSRATAPPRPLRNTYPSQGAREKADRLIAIFPGAACPVAHWGYVYSGKARVEYVNQPEEIFNAGDFFVPPGHRPYMLEDTELLRITDKDEFGAFMKQLGDAGLTPR